MLKARLKGSVRFWLSTALGAAVFIAIVAFGYVQSSTTFRDSESYAVRMKSCEEGVLRHVSPDPRAPVGLSLLNDVSTECYNDILNYDQLGESNITRGMYIHQRYENNVILFMVVIITLSGVGLAGVQLLTSYNLAATGHLAESGPTELTVEQGKLAIKSSVTGLVVLALSLVFFVVYVLEVYRITPAAEPAASSNTAAEDQTRSPPAVDNAAIAPPPFETGGGDGPPPEAGQRP